MPYLIGIDEAGYGPNIGPLVISISVWRVADALASADPSVDLWDALSDAIARRPTVDRIAIADSKQLYQPGGGIAALELGVLAALAQLDRRPADWRSIWSSLDPSALDAIDSMPWYADYSLKAPIELESTQVDAAADRLGEVLHRAGVQLCSLRSRVVFERQFNQMIDEHGNKATVLSRETLSLLSGEMSQCNDDDIIAICDKHGGRNCYGRLLQEFFPDDLIETRLESSAESAYCWRPARRSVDVRFRARGESFLPAALASMTSKYLREISMKAVNNFWRVHIEGLKPTAGYPQDARRFRADTTAARSALGIADEMFWRCR